MTLKKQVYPLGGEVVICKGQGDDCWFAPSYESHAHDIFAAPGATSRLSDPVLDQLVQDLNAAVRKARATRVGDDVDIVFSLREHFIVPVWGKCCGEIGFDEIDNATQMKILGIMG